MPIITLTTDFGSADGYVGAMKGVILGIAPDVRLVDLSHEIAAQDVRGAEYVLGHAAAFFLRVPCILPWSIPVSEAGGGRC